MKELSIEEKAKAYDEALKEAIIAHKDEDKHLRATLERIFPELKESDDERIRKEIIAFLTYYHTGQGNSVKYDDGWIAWLEKQKHLYETTKDRFYCEGFEEGQLYERQKEHKHDENSGKPSENVIEKENMPEYNKGFECGKQRVLKYPEEFGLCKKPANKVEPKFKVGDIVQYITDSTDRRKIEEVDTLRNMYHTDGLSIMFEVEDEWKVVVNAEDVEQKPSDTAEPKFKVGDWIVYNDIVLYIFHITINKYYDCGKPDGTLRSFDSSIDAQSHLWTIEDAKEGDVLVVDDRPFIYNGNVNPLSVGGYCGITCDGHFKKYEKPIGHSTDGWTDGWTMYDNNIHPATKEQRDTLFEKMRESGYDWEAEKKELNPIFDTDEEKDSDYHTKGEIIMTRGELLEFLTKEAIKFREKPNFININKHLTGIDENNMPSKEQIDGVLVAFINYVGMSQCIDYALSYKDLDKEK